MGWMYQTEGISPAEARGWQQHGTFEELKDYYESRKGKGALLGHNTGQASPRDPGYLIRCPVL